MACRAMFGGYGLYLNDRFFGIIHKSRLYFKTNSDNCEPYLRAKSQPFRPNPKQTLKNYYEVPPDIVEDSELLRAWALKAAETD